MVITSHLPVAVEIRLDVEILHHDIKAFVVAEVEKLPQFSKMAGEIEHALIDGAKGMFLWVSLVLDDLRRSCTTKSRVIQEKLKSLPRSLPGLYENILRKVEPVDQPTANIILQWVVWASRPLTLKELTIAVAIRPQDTSLSSMEEEMESDLRTVLRMIFGPLITVDDDKTVHLVHQSAKDFLSQPDISPQHGSHNQSLSGWRLSPIEAHRRLGIGCLKYMAFEFKLKNEPVDSKIDRSHISENAETLRIGRGHNLLSYAVKYWQDHVRQTDQRDPDVLRAFLALRKPGKNNFLVYSVSRMLRNWYQEEDRSVRSSLYVAIVFELFDFAEELVKCRCVSDLSDRIGILMHHSSLRHSVD